MNADDFEAAVGEAAQDAVWKTQHPLTHHLADDDPRRAQYLREYHQSVGRQVLAAIRKQAENLQPRSSSLEAQTAPASTDEGRAIVSDLESLPEVSAVITPATST